MSAAAGLPATILVADWSKDPAKRAVWIADVPARRLRSLDASRWDLAELLGAAREHRDRGPVLVGLDLVFGVSRGYWEAATARAPWRGARSFVELLARVEPDAEFWGTSPRASEWRVERPFHAVPSGAGQLLAFGARAGFDLRRPIDRRCGSKPPFVVSGIPGTVGSGTRALWRELAPLLRRERDFLVWPFEGTLARQLRGDAVLLAELYPAVAYAVALLDGPPVHQLRIGKTRPAQRGLALDVLARAGWVAGHGVDLGDLDRARGSEDEFDALAGAAALLRSALEGAVPENSATDDPVAEGGILLTGAVDLSLPARTLESVFGPVAGDAAGTPAKRRSTRRSSPARTALRCPIDGCDKVFAAGRAGWDAHVASPGRHRDWYPEITDGEERKRLFKRDFPDW